MIRCPECLTWMEQLASRQPVSTPGRRAYWDDDPVYGCEACGEQWREDQSEKWIEQEECDEQS